MLYENDGTQSVETAAGTCSVHELGGPWAERAELRAAVIAERNGAERTFSVSFTAAELSALDELIASGASISLRVRGHAYPRELHSAQRSIQSALLASRG